MTTTTREQTLQTELNSGNPNTMGDCLRRMKAGFMASRLKVTCGSLTAAAVIDVTTEAFKEKITELLGMTLEDGQTLPAIGQVVSLRVTTASAGTTVGTYGITDSGGTAIVPPGGASAAMGIAELSDDGTTLTFPANVTGFVLSFYPAPAEDMEEPFAVI